MALNFKTYRRDFSEPLSIPPAVYEVLSYSWRTIGGPNRASVSVSGSLEALVQMLDMLRCPVEISNDNAQPVWWGYVSEVRIRSGVYEIGVSLDSLGNSVTVVYARVAGGQTTAGERATTAAGADANSIAEYGTKELRISASDSSDTQALRLRDAVLDQRKLPLAEIRNTGATAEGSASATIECRGWWETLGWQYYSDAVRVEENTTLGGPKDHPTLNLGNTGLAQSFTFADATAVWAVDSVELLLGGFNHDLTLSICADNGLAAAGPGTVLASATLAAGGVDLEAGDTNRTTFTFDTPVNLSGGTTYWLQLSNGAIMWVNWNASLSNPYARGELRMRDSALRWTSSIGGQADGAWDAPFKINGIVQTTQQIAAVVTGKGQFITATDIENASGVWSSPFRDGDKTALAVIEDLLKAGTANGRRLLATVTVDRRLRVYEEPAAAAGTYSAAISDSTIYDPYDTEVSPELCPVGVWVAIRDMPPLTDYANALVSPSPFFVEEATYDARQDVYKPTPRGIQSAWNLGGLKR